MVISLDSLSLFFFFFPGLTCLSLPLTKVKKSSYEAEPRDTYLTEYFCNSVGPALLVLIE